MVLRMQRNSDGDAMLELMVGSLDELVTNLGSVLP
jgi:hypothetical protein